MILGNAQLLVLRWMSALVKGEKGCGEDAERSGLASPMPNC